jgi:hypothetical protein
MANEEHVDFVPKPGVTLYVGSGSFRHDPSNPARLPKALAEAWDDHRHKPEAAKPAVNDTAAKAAASESRRRTSPTLRNSAP